jgi:hypothetical protein
LAFGVILCQSRIQHADAAHRPALLRARRKRPRRRPAKRGYEFSPSDVDCHATLHGVMPMQWGDDITL